MATTIYTRKLLAHYEAEDNGGANNSPVSVLTDLSGNGRDLVCASSQPLVKTAAINGKRSVNFDGTKNPLVFTGDMTIRCGFLVVKVGAAFSGDRGLLTGPAAAPILVGAGGTSSWKDLGYEYYEYRLTDRIYPDDAAPAPVGSFGIIYFKFWTNIAVTGIQLGRDRAVAGTGFNGEVAFMALYNRDFCEAEVRKMTQALANSYQLALPKVFPLQGQKSDRVTTGKRVITDEQDLPVVRVKRPARRGFDLSFEQRTQAEFLEAEAFWDDVYPSKSFIFRDGQLVPPRDSVVRCPVPSEFTRNGVQTVNNFNFAFPVVETTLALTSAIPPAPSIPSEIIPDTTAPSTPGVPTVTGAANNTLNISWTGSVDDTGVTGYELQHATNSGFTGATTVVLAAVTSTSLTELPPATTYYVRVRARDAVGNWSPYSAAGTGSTLAAYTPAAEANVALWNKADSLSLADNASVTSWSDSSGVSGPTAGPGVVGQAPKFRTNIAKGGTMPVLRFDASLSSMRSQWTRSGSSWTMSFVYAWTGSGSALRRLVGTRGANWFFGPYSSSAPEKHEYYDGAFAASSMGGAVSGQFYIVTIVVAGSTTSIYIDGTLANSRTTGSQQPGLITFGIDNDFGEAAESDLAEFAGFSAALGTTSRQKLEGYLAHKWFGAGSSNNLPTGHPFKDYAPTV